MYLTVSTIAADQNMRNRVAACAAEQGNTTPESWAYTNSYVWASAPGWAAKWESAVAAGNPNPGSDPAVITDGDILSVVQPMLGAA
jgi:hypothetical protein